MQAGPLSAPLPADVVTRVDDLRKQIDQLASSVDHLPANNEQTYRLQLSQGLEEVIQALRLAGSDQNSGTFQSQVDAITKAIGQLRTQPTDVTLRAHTTVALRAVRNALHDIYQKHFSDTASIKGHLMGLDSTLPALDSSQGALYRVAATDTFSMAVATLRQFADAYSALQPHNQPAAPSAETKSEPAADQADANR